MGSDGNSAVKIEGEGVSREFPSNFDVAPKAIPIPHQKAESCALSLFHRTVASLSK